MPEIIIKSCGSVANIDAMEACVKFVDDNILNGYKHSRVIDTKRGFELTVSEFDHDNFKESPFSVVFVVENRRIK